MRLGLYVIDGMPVYTYNVANLERYSARSTKKLAPGKHTIRYSFDYEGGGPGRGGVGTLFVDGAEVAQVNIKRTMGFRISLDETFDIGMDTGTQVSDLYTGTFGFNGELDRVIFTVSDDNTVPPRALPANYY